MGEIPDDQVPDEGLRWIAESPPQKAGGFHPEAIKTARAALVELSRLRAVEAMTNGWQGWAQKIVDCGDNGICVEKCQCSTCAFIRAVAAGEAVEEQ